ncbi:energy transducer TonB [Balneatrix alpica]|uniref:Protein TonB n=1 Tax=Balneatrix alpica TaxID=75684 RepID=A0ABV5ZH29_9GAMM|nr:energy transducer TonB [Balneatrix alpica]
MRLSVRGAALVLALLLSLALFTLMARLVLPQQESLQPDWQPLQMEFGMAPELLEATPPAAEPPPPPPPSAELPQSLELTEPVLPQLDPPPLALAEPDIRLPLDVQVRLDQVLVEKVRVEKPKPAKPPVAKAEPAPAQPSAKPVAKAEPRPAPPAVPASQGLSMEAQALSKVPPDYPNRALRRRIEGKVTVEFTVEADGRVRPGSAKIIEAQPQGYFERGVLQAIYRWRFKPRLEQGQGVSFRARQTLEFRLKS